MGKIDQWCRGKQLGSGATGTVSIATNCNSGEAFAVKSMLLDRAEAREQGILSSLNSPFVVAYLGFDISMDSSTGEFLYNLFMEYAPGGSLADEIKNLDKRVTESYIRRRTFEILSGLVYLHENRIAHCDIKGQNILISSDGIAKIADFGCSKLESSENEKLQIRGTPMYMAPEVARGEEQGAPADVWALGCVVIGMITGGAPWQGFSNPAAIMYHVGNSWNIPKIPNWISEQGRDFLSKCLNRDPRQRWTAEKLLNHPFVSKSEILIDEEVRETPKSVLDQDMWKSLTGMAMLTDPLARISFLATTKSSIPNWTTDDKSWTTVRRQRENSFAKSPSTSNDHMIPEGLEFDSHDLDFDNFVNKNSLEEEVQRRKIINLHDSCSFIDDSLHKRKRAKFSIDSPK